MCSTVLSLTPQRKRASTTLGPTGMSLLCSAAFSWLFHAPVAPVPAVRLIYGIVVVADSPAYSVSLMELVPPRSLGGTSASRCYSGGVSRRSLRRSSARYWTLPNFSVEER